MILKSQRTINELSEVLTNPDFKNEHPAYWVFSKLKFEEWVNMTILAPTIINGEFNKTYGHYHTTTREDEIYKVVSGTGLFMLQKKHFANGTWIENMVDEIYLINAKPGDEIVVKTDFGHSWSNIGKSPLITYDNWDFGHSPNDYTPIKKLKGMAYYLLAHGSDFKFDWTPVDNFPTEVQKIAAAGKEWTYIELPSSHVPMASMPGRFSQLLVEAGIQ